MVVGLRLKKQTYFRREWVRVGWKTRTTTVPKKMLTQSQTMFRRKRSWNISESDVLQNIQEGIITGFGIKSVEHKEWFSCSVLMLIIFLVPEETVMTLVYHGTLIFENFFYLPAKKVIPRALFVWSFLICSWLSGLQIPPQLLQSYYSLFMPHDISEGLRNVQDVGCLRCRTLRM